MDWRTFALFFFTPDLSMLGHFAGRESAQPHTTLGTLTSVD
jgi:hypothetical protein